MITEIEKRIVNLLGYKSVILDSTSYYYVPSIHKRVRDATINLDENIELKNALEEIEKTMDEGRLLPVRLSLILKIKKFTGQQEYLSRLVKFPIERDSISILYFDSWYEFVLKELVYKELEGILS